MTNLAISPQRRKHAPKLPSPQTVSALIRECELRQAPLPVRRIARRFQIPVDRAAVIAALAGIGGAHERSP